MNQYTDWEIRHVTRVLFTVLLFIPAPLSITPMDQIAGSGGSVLQYPRDTPITSLIELVAALQRGDKRDEGCIDFP